MTISQNVAVAWSGDRRSMNEPRFQTAMPDTKYAKTRFRRLPRLRASVMTASRTFRTSAKSGRRLWSVKGVPLGVGEREIGLVLLALFVDLVLEDAEDEDVPEPAILVTGLAEDALLLEPVAPQRVRAQAVVLVDLGLDAPEPEYIDSIIRDEFARLHAKSAPDGLLVGQHHLEEAVAFQEVDVEQARQADGFGPAAVGLDHQDDRVRIGQDRLVECGVLVVDVLVGVQELAADHPLDERIFRPLRQVLEILRPEGAQIDARAARHDALPVDRPAVLARRPGCGLHVGHPRPPTGDCAPAAPLRSTDAARSRAVAHARWLSPARNVRRTSSTSKPARSSASRSSVSLR